jgi:hypothetical protein
MRNSRLKIKIITSDRTNEKVQELLYQNIAKQIFESAEFQVMLKDNINSLREAL